MIYSLISFSQNPPPVTRTANGGLEIVDGVEVIDNNNEGGKLDHKGRAKKQKKEKTQKVRLEKKV